MLRRRTRFCCGQQYSTTVRRLCGLLAGVCDDWNGDRLPHEMCRQFRGWAGFPDPRLCCCPSHAITNTRSGCTATFRTCCAHSDPAAAGVGLHRRDGKQQQQSSLDHRVYRSFGCYAQPPVHLLPYQVSIAKQAHKSRTEFCCKFRFSGGGGRWEDVTSGAGTAASSYDCSCGSTTFPGSGPRCLDVK